jgi:hypothetical protein
MKNMKTLLSRSSSISGPVAFALSVAGPSHRHTPEEKQQWSEASDKMQTAADGAVASNEKQIVDIAIN